MHLRFSVRLVENIIYRLFLTQYSPMLFKKLASISSKLINVKMVNVLDSKLQEKIPRTKNIIKEKCCNYSQV